MIIGGGVAGLGAAYKVARAASEGHDVGFVLIEKDRRLGGKIRTEMVRDLPVRPFGRRDVRCGRRAGLFPNRETGVSSDREAGGNLRG